jgi:Ca2+-binding RTX toxin-like protein
MASFEAVGTIDGSAEISASVIQSIHGAVTLEVTHDASIWYNAVVTFSGTASESGWFIADYNWSGAASNGDDPGEVDQNGSALTFTGIGYRDGDTTGTNGVSFVVHAHIVSGNTVVIDDAAIRFAIDEFAIGSDFSAFARLFRGGPGNDTLTGTDAAEVFRGNAGNDLINAGGGNDTVFGGAGADTLSGAAGKDSIDGGAGNDSIDGGAGADILYAQDGNDKVSGGDGDDLLIGGSGKGDDRYTGGAGIDTLRYSSATHAVTASLAGGRGSGLDIGNDTIASVENLIGGAGADKLTGNGGANVLTGNAGNDILKGGAGHDKLTGGTGADAYVYSEAPLAANSDSIVGFQSGSDKIQLDDVVFSSLRTLGTLSSADFDTYLDYTSGKLYYDADGAGPGGGLLIATLSGAPTLAAGDIVVI